jgi:hypothetical protein
MQRDYSKLPIYRLVVRDEEPEEAVSGIALVTSPAIEKGFRVFSKLEKLTPTGVPATILESEDAFLSAENRVVIRKANTFKASNSEKQIVFGPLLIPNQLIYRETEQGEPYLAVFYQEDINNLYKKLNRFTAAGNKIPINFQHNQSAIVNAELGANFIDDSVGAGETFDFDTPAGTWFAFVKINDREFFESVVTGKVVRGFSIEVLTAMEKIKDGTTLAKQPEIFEPVELPELPDLPVELAQKIELATALRLPEVCNKLMSDRDAFYRTFIEQSIPLIKRILSKIKKELKGSADPKAALVRKYEDKLACEREELIRWLAGNYNTVKAELSPFGKL